MLSLGIAGHRSDTGTGLPALPLHPCLPAGGHAFPWPDQFAVLKNSKRLEQGHPRVIFQKPSPCRYAAASVASGRSRLKLAT